MSSPTGQTFSEEYLKADKGPGYLALIIFCPALASIIVALRLFTRLKIVRSCSHEDWTILAALVFSIGTAICQGFQVHYGMGRHVQAIPIENTMGSLKGLWVSVMTYNLGLTLVKASIDLQYLRIAVNPIIRKWCWGLLVFIVMIGIYTFFGAMLACTPIPKFWNATIPGRCINLAAFWYANSAIAIVTDLWLMILPIFIIKDMSLGTREKLSLFAILALGGLATIASILRLHSLYTLSITTDITWDNGGAAVWSTIEVNVAIICTSLPTLRALVIRIFPRAFKSSSGAVYAHHARQDVSGNGKIKLYKKSIRKEVGIVVESTAANDLETGKSTFFDGDSDHDAFVLDKPKA